MDEKPTRAQIEVAAELLSEGGYDVDFFLDTLNREQMDRLIKKLWEVKQHADD